MSNQFWSPNHPTINPNRLTRASTRVGGSREALAIAYCATSNFPPQSPPKLLPRSPVLVRFWFVLVVFVGRLLVVCWCCLGRPPPHPTHTHFVWSKQAVPLGLVFDICWHMLMCILLILRLVDQAKFLPRPDVVWFPPPQTTNFVGFVLDPFWARFGSMVVHPHNLTTKHKWLNKNTGRWPREERRAIF